MLDYEKLDAVAKASGFTHTGPLEAGKLRMLQEVRDMCAADKCHLYNRSWGCPPACGTLDEMREKVSHYSRGLIVQTVGELEDSLDFDGMQDAAMRHAGSFKALWNTLLAEYSGLLAMGSGGCARCEKCTYPDALCRFPDEVAASMEACGLLVSQVCADNGVKYHYGSGTIAYTACFLLE
jgi:predicted metal-binding protein